MPRPLLLFAALVGAGLLAVGALNIVFGGGSDLLRGASEMQDLVRRQVASGDALLAPPDFNDRYYKRALIRQRATEIKAIVTGSSRVFLLDAAAFESVLGVERRAFLNAGMQGSTLEDHVIIWQICKESGLVPDTFFLGLDPWILNENSGESRWEALDGEFRRFSFAGDSVGDSLRRVLSDRSIRYQWLKLTDLLGTPRLLVSLKELRRRAGGGKSDTDAEKPQLVAEAAVPPQRAGKRVDGSAIYPLSEMQARFTGEVAEQVLGQARAGKFYQFGGWTELSVERAQLLRRLLQDMRAHGVRVVGFTVPYVHGYYGLLRENRNYARLLRQQSRLLGEIFAAQDFEYHDLLDPAVPGLIPDHFTDYIHPTRDGMLKVLAHIRDRSTLLKKRP